MSNETLLSIKRNTLIIVSFAAVVGLSLAITYSLTKEQIAEQLAIAQSKALNQVVPKPIRDNVLLNSPFALESQSQVALNLHDNQQQGWRAIKAGIVTAVVVPVNATNGYSGEIQLLVGIASDLSITGVRVVSHTETPGLGDKIELRKSDWVLSFDGKTMSLPVNSWAVKKDGGQFDQFTGATITPRAVVGAVYNALEQAKANQDRWFSNEH